MLVQCNHNLPFVSHRTIGTLSLSLLLQARSEVQPSASVDVMPTRTSALTAEQPRSVPDQATKTAAAAQPPTAAVAAAGPGPLQLARQAPESDNEGASDVCKAPTPKVMFRRMRKGQATVVSHSNCLKRANLD